jgi:hypothetical protein
MDFIPLEMLKNTRDIIGMAICLIAFIILLKSKSGFKQILYAELLKKDYQKIHHRLTVMEEMNVKTFNMVRRIDESSQNSKFIPEIWTDAPKESKPANKTQIDYGACLSLPDYQKIKELIHFGMSESEIREIAGLPDAEIDFIFKFNRLNKLSQYQNHTYIKKSATA